jgi:hypothetical protein
VPADKTFATRHLLYPEPQSRFQMANYAELEAV